MIHVLNPTSCFIKSIENKINVKMLKDRYSKKRGKSTKKKVNPTLNMNKNPKSKNNINLKIDLYFIIKIVTSQNKNIDANK
jgi:hypothetical protein